MLSRLLYSLSTRAYTLGIRLVSPFNPKARKWLRGRRGWQPPLAAFAGSVDRSKHPLVWMHCASLGEYEQGRPVLEALRQQWPHIKILVSFFSPSGYEVKKDDALANYTCYLPADSAANARRFVETVQPALVIWVKYEYWRHYLVQVKQRQIPALLVSAVFRAGQPFFKWYGGLWRQMLGCFTQIFVQDEASRQLLQPLQLTNVAVGGDTRFDRVLHIAANFEPVPFIASFCGNEPVIVAGSTWPEDEEELDHYAISNPGIRFIIAPHEIDEDHLKEAEGLFKNTIRYSQLAAGAAVTPGVNTLIIDNIGMLSRLYNYATITYVGGGFGSDGVHNVLEAAVYGRPVIFGPEYEKYREAVELEAAGGAFSIENALELEETFDGLLTNHNEYVLACEAARRYVQGRGGATAQITRYVEENRLLKP